MRSIKPWPTCPPPCEREGKNTIAARPGRSSGDTRVSPALLVQRALAQTTAKQLFGPVRTGNVILLNLDKKLGQFLVPLAIGIIRILRIGLRALQSMIEHADQIVVRIRSVRRNALRPGGLIHRILLVLRSTLTRILLHLFSSSQSGMHVSKRL